MSCDSGRNFHSSTLRPRPSVGSDFGVLLPKACICRESDHHLRPLAIPLGVFGAVENLLGHITWANNRAYALQTLGTDYEFVVSPLIGSIHILREGNKVPFLGSKHKMVEKNNPKPLGQVFQFSGRRNICLARHWITRGVIVRNDDFLCPNF